MNLTLNKIHSRKRAKAHKKVHFECNNTLFSFEAKQKEKCPTWSTLNSFLSEKQTIWRVGITVPLYKRSPKEWPVLFTIHDFETGTEDFKLSFTTAALKCLRKYIEGSGLDLVWKISGIYGSATVGQILEGRHIYQGMGAHTITVLAVYTLFMQVFLKDEEKNEINVQAKEAAFAY